MLLSEDDLRSKVIYEWLKDCGMSILQFSIEHTINLRLGKGTRTFHSRSDVVVRNDEGKNLLIIEVKKPDHNLSVGDELQAISYARSLVGNIAPFTILTNGNSSIIFDSISGERLEGDSIPQSHPHVLSGFIPSGGGITARLEALKFLISFSEDNLLTFCKGQMDFRMKFLKGEDLYGGKKYIPQLYTERTQTLSDLKGKIFDNADQKRNLILVIGPPQHGKTCFMCHTAEHFLSEGYPALFYPAIGLTSGLIPAIQEDFDWCFGEHMEPAQWIKRLNAVGERLGKKIFIFIDGWNEMAEKALEINYECQRLGLNQIVIVLSTTSPSLQRLLVDTAGNPGYIAESVDLSYPQIEKMLSEPLKDTKKLGIVQIGKFDYTESTKAYEIYGKAYNVCFQTQDFLLSDPFYLRLACELYSGGEVPTDITRTELIKNSLELKGKRRNINKSALYDTLVDLAEVFYSYDRPSSIFNFPKYLRDEEKLVPWLESAILTLPNVNCSPHLDFYYSHDLDFSVAILFKNWRKVFEASSETEVLKELKDSFKTEVGQSALKWLLSNPENCDLIQWLFDVLKFDNYLDLKVVKLLSECIVKQVLINRKIELQWLEHHLSKIVDFEMNDDIHGSELPGLIFSLLMSLDRNKSKDTYAFWMRLLVKYDNTMEELGIQESYIHRFYGGEEEEIRDLYGYDDTTLDVDLFRNLILDKDIVVAKRAAYVYAYTSQFTFLMEYPSIRMRLYKLKHDYKTVLMDACNQIAYDLGDQYYGYSMCKGWLEHLKGETNDEMVKSEYFKMKPLLSPIIAHYANEEFSNNLSEMLDDLKKVGGVIEDEIQWLSSNDPNQLMLDF